MGQIIRDLGMTMLVALVIHALYAARHMRPPPPVSRATESQQPIYTAAAQAAPVVTEQQQPSGFSVFPWAP